MFVLDFDDMFDRYVSSQEKEWKHDRATTVGASEVFDCLRKVGAEKRHKEFGIEPDEDYEDNWGATHRGDMIENNYLVPAILYGLPKEIPMLMAGKEQVTLVLGRNSATPDGLLTDLPPGPLQIKAGGKVIDIPDFEGGELGLEFKSIDPRAILKEERAKHYGQTQVGMGLTRELTEWKPKYWLILYVDASFVNKFTPFLITYDENVFRAAKLRAPKVWAAKKLHDLPAEGKLDGGCDHCRWRRACGEAILSEYAKTSDKAAKDPELVEAVSDEVSDFLAKQLAAKAAERAFKEAQQTLKDKLLAHKARRVRGDQWSVSWYTQPGRKSVNWKKIVEDFEINTEDYETTGVGFDVLKVTPKAESTSNE